MVRILFDVPSEADAARLATVLRDASVRSSRPREKRLWGDLAAEIDDGLDVLAELFEDRP